jgi:hypothetical protein
VLAGFDHGRVIALARQADADAVVRWPELDHVHAWHAQDRLQIFDGGFLFDHEYDDTVLIALDELERPADRGTARVIAMRARAAGHLGLGDAHAFLGIRGSAHVGE